MVFRSDISYLLFIIPFFLFVGIESDAMADCRTASWQVLGNLDSRVALTDAPPTDLNFNALAEKSAYSSELKITDLSEVPHTIHFYFSHTSKYTWTVDAYVSAADVGAISETLPLRAGSTSLLFNEKGELLLSQTLISTPSWAPSGERDSLSFLLGSVASHPDGNDIKFSGLSTTITPCVAYEDVDTKNEVNGGIETPLTKGIKDSPLGYESPSEQ